MEEKDPNLESVKETEEIKHSEDTPKTKGKNKDGHKKKSRFNEIKAEFSKIIWVSRKDLAKQTATVITVSAIFGVIIFGMDSVFNFGYSLLASLLNKG